MITQNIEKPTGNYEKYGNQCGLLGKQALNLEDYVKVEVDKLIPGTMEHTNRNLLVSIDHFSMLILGEDLIIDNPKIFDDLLENMLSKKDIDFAFLLGFIRMNYDGNIDENIHFKKLLKVIKKLEKNLQFTDEELFSKAHIFVEELFNISFVEMNVKISNKEKINDGYYIKFEGKSYLGNLFNIEPILIEIIHDLVHNSIKYSNEGTQISIFINQTIDNITISVLDEGHGIKQEDINKVFKYRVRLDNVGNQKGNGEGGAKCAYVVEMLGGNIHVKSKVGVGTEVIIRIPNKL